MAERKLISRRNFTLMLIGAAAAGLSLIPSHRINTGQINPPSGEKAEKPEKGFRIGAEEKIDTSPVKNLPDGHISFIKFNRLTRTFIPAGRQTLMYETRNESNPVSQSSLYKDPVLSPGPGEDYAAFGSIVEVSGKLVGFYHKEIHHNRESHFPFDASIARAYSEDGGQTWIKRVRF